MPVLIENFLLALGSGLLVSLATLFLHQVLTASRRRVERRLSEVTPAPVPPPGQATEPFPMVSRMLMSAGYFEGLRNRLAGAGLAWRPSEFVVLVIFSTAVLFVLGLSLRGNILLGIALGAIGFFTPHLTVFVMQIRRRRLFENQLADALSLAAASVRAGFSFLRALQVIVEETDKPISAEFATALREVKLGASIGEALQRVAERMRSEDFDVVVTAVLVHLEVGGNLTEILEIVARTIRERRRIRGEIKTLTAQGRMSGWVVGSLPFAIAGIISVLNPQYLLPLFTERVGIVMILIGLTMQLAGILAIRRIVSLDI